MPEPFENLKKVPANAKIIPNPETKKAALRFFIAFPNAGGQPPSGARLAGPVGSAL
jgi:hypothetical protein